MRIAALAACGGRTPAARQGRIDAIPATPHAPQPSESGFNLRPQRVFSHIPLLIDHLRPHVATRRLRNTQMKLTASGVVGHFVAHGRQRLK